MIALKKQTKLMQMRLLASNWEKKSLTLITVIKTPFLGFCYEGLIRATLLGALLLRAGRSGPGKPQEA